VFIQRAMCVTEWKNRCLVFLLQSAKASWMVTSSFVRNWTIRVNVTEEFKILRIKLNTIHLYQHYSLFMPKTLQYTWCGDYCKWVQPAQLPHHNWILSSVPLGTTFMIRSPLRPGRVRLHVPNPQLGSNHCLSFSTLHYFNTFSPAAI